MLRHPEFRLYIFSRFFFILVLNMQATLISWKVYEITKDPFSIGLIGLIEFVPAVIMAFFAGHIIDLSDKRKMMLAAMAANVVLTLTLTGITSNFSLQTFSSSIILTVIYAVVFCTGILRSFSGPTSFAMVSQLIPKDELPNAITWHSGSWQIGAVSGPALAGILYGTIGVTPTFSLMIGLFVAALIPISLMRPKPPVPQTGQESMLLRIREGFRFVWRTKEVLGTMSLDLFAVFFGGATALLPYFADVILKTGPQPGDASFRTCRGLFVCIGMGHLQATPKTTGQADDALCGRIWSDDHPLRPLANVLALHVCPIHEWRARWDLRDRPKHHPAAQNTRRDARPRGLPE